MNMSLVKIMLEEGARDLQALLLEIERVPNFEEVEFSIQLNEIYGSINTAWNARNVSDDEAAKRSEEKYYEWRQFPRDIFMS